MAGIGKRSNGKWFVRYVDQAGKRHTIGLDSKSERKAGKAKLAIEDLLVEKKTGQGIDPETKVWLDRLKDTLRQKLLAKGLIGSPRAACGKQPKVVTVGSMLTDYISKRNDVKPATKVNWRHTKRNLLTFFGSDKPLCEITAGDAKDFERYLKTTARENRYADKKKEDGLNPDTVRKRIGNAKQFFADAVDRELLVKNPFAGLTSAQQGNTARQFTVTPAMTRKVFDACPPDSEWPLIFALARYGGLRCPSELLRLRLCDVNWEQGRFLVHAPKTEHHEGKATRWVPIFPELRPYLEAAWDAVDPEQEPKQEYFITVGRGKSNSYHRTMLTKIIRRAGLTPWPKLWQNLRSTRQTELEEQFPSHVVCAWLGNSVQVARKHYLQVTAEHFDRALHMRSSKAPQGAANEKCDVGKTAENRSISHHVARGVGDTGFEPVTSAV